MNCVSRRVLVVMCNLDESSVGLRLGALAIRAWPYEKLLKRLARIENVPDWTIETSLDFENGTLRAGDVVLTAEGQMDWPDDEKAVTEAERHRMWRLQHAFFRSVENHARRLRLYAEGHPAIRATYVYKIVGRRPELVQSTKYLSPVEDHAFELDAIVDVESFLERCSLSFAQEYIHLAWENFEESFEAGDTKLKFLLLMIAMEILFNDGQQELKYKIARAAAIVLGADVQQSREVFSRMKKLYDKRSQLVHTGRAQAVLFNDVIELRRFVRQALRRLNQLELPKDELVRIVTESGFGAFNVRLQDTRQPSHGSKPAILRAIVKPPRPKSTR